MKLPRSVINFQMGHFVYFSLFTVFALFSHFEAVLCSTSLKTTPKHFYVLHLGLFGTLNYANANFSILKLALLILVGITILILVH